MILSDRDIRIYHSKGWLGITPWKNDRIQPASYDVAVSYKFRALQRGVNTFIDPLRKQEGLTRPIQVEAGEKFILHPGEFALGMTEEFVSLGRGVAGRVEGKSSLGRLGLVIHSTAGWLDPGFRGTVTLELSNAAGLPIVITPGMLIGQIAFMKLTSTVERPYGSNGLNSKYQGDVEPAESRYHQQHST